MSWLTMVRIPSRIKILLTVLFFTLCYSTSAWTMSRHANNDSTRLNEQKLSQPNASGQASQNLQSSDLPQPTFPWRTLMCCLFLLGLLRAGPAEFDKRFWLVAMVGAITLLFLSQLRQPLEQVQLSNFWPEPIQQIRFSSLLCVIGIVSYWSMQKSHPHRPQKKRALVASLLCLLVVIYLLPASLMHKYYHLFPAFVLAAIAIGLPRSALGLSLQGKIRSIFKTATQLTILAVGLYFDFWANKADALSPISFIDSWLVVASWLSFERLLDHRSDWRNFQAEDQKRRLYLQNLTQYLRLDISKVLYLSQSTLKPPVANDPAALAGDEIKSKLYHALKTIELTELRLERWESLGACQYGRIRIQDLFDSILSLCNPLAADHPHIIFRASYNWEDPSQWIVIDSNLITSSTFEIIKGLMASTPPEQNNIITLNMTVDSSGQKFRLTIQDQIPLHPHDSSKAAEPHEYQRLFLSIEYSKKLMESLSGRLLFSDIDKGGRLIHIDCELPKYKAPSMSNSLPRKPAPVYQVASSEGNTQLLAEPTKGSKQELLIIDQDFESFRALRQIAEFAGFDSTHLADLNQTVASLSRQTFDCLLIHDNGHKYFGPGFVQNIRASKVYGQMPILFISSIKDEAYRIACINAGVDDFILHPVTPQEIIAWLNKSYSRWNHAKDLFKLHLQSDLKKEFQHGFFPGREMHIGLQANSHSLAGKLMGRNCVQTFHDYRHHRFYAIIGSISGHGYAPILLSAQTSGAFRATMRSFTQTRQVLPMDRCLRELIEGIHHATADSAQKFRRSIALSFISIDMTNGDCFYCNAGQGPIYLIRENKLEPIFTGGRPLGVTADINLNYRRFQLSSNSAIFMSTSGLVSNQSANLKRFTHRQLQKVLSQEEHLHNKNLAEAVIREARTFWLDETPENDITTLVIYWSHASNPLLIQKDNAS